MNPITPSSDLTALTSTSSSHRSYVTPSQEARRARVHRSLRSYMRQHSVPTSDEGGLNVSEVIDNVTDSTALNRLGRALKQNNDDKVAQLLNGQDLRRLFRSLIHYAPDHQIKILDCLISKGLPIVDIGELLPQAIEKKNFVIANHMIKILVDKGANPHDLVKFIDDDFYREALKRDLVEVVKLKYLQECPEGVILNNILTAFKLRSFAVTSYLLGKYPNWENLSLKMKLIDESIPIQENGSDSVDIKHSQIKKMCDSHEYLNFLTYFARYQKIHNTKIHRHAGKKDQYLGELAWFDPDAQSRTSVLLLAVQSNNPLLCRALVESNQIDFSVNDVSKNNFFHYLASSQNEELVREVESHINLTNESVFEALCADNNKKQTPHHIAIEEGNFSVFELFFNTQKDRTLFRVWKKEMLASVEKHMKNYAKSPGHFAIETLLRAGEIEDVPVFDPETGSCTFVDRTYS